ncbi:TRAP transporter small permease [Chloroflexota bacterium]
MNIPNLVRSTGRRFITVQKWIIIVASAALVIDIFIEVLLRYVFKHPIFGTDELASMIAVWVYFIGAAHATHTKVHIEGGFMSAVLKQQSHRDIVRFAVLVVTLIVGFVFAYMSFEWCLWTVENKVATTSLFFPKIYGDVAMLIGAVLMIVYFSIEATEILRRLRQGSTEEP